MLFRSMVFRSMRFRLLALWLVLLLSAAATAFLLVSFFEETASAQVDRAKERTAQACRAIAERYAFFSSGWSGPGPEGLAPDIRAQLTQVVQAALSDATSVEGGIWQAAAGAQAIPMVETAASAVAAVAAASGAAAAAVIAGAAADRIPVVAAAHMRPERARRPGRQPPMPAPAEEP